MDGGCVKSVCRPIVGPVVRGVIGTSVAVAQWTLNSLPDDIATEYFATITSEGGTISGSNQSKVRTLLNALQTAGLYRKVRALYLYHGGTANAARHNAINPGTHPGSMVITWTGTPTFDSDGGMTPTADDYGVPALHPDANGLTAITGAGLGFYSSSNAATSEYTMGVYDSFFIAPKVDSISANRLSGTLNTGDVQDLSGFHFATREPNSSVVRAYRNGTMYMDTTKTFSSSYLPDSSTAARVRLGGMIELPSTSYASTTPVKLSIVTQGITEAEMVDLNSAIQDYVS